MKNRIWDKAVLKMNFNSLPLGTRPEDELKCVFANLFTIQLNVIDDW